jgi:hypothetical protein
MTPCHMLMNCKAHDNRIQAAFQDRSELGVTLNIFGSASLLPFLAQQRCSQLHHGGQGWVELIDTDEGYSKYSSQPTLSQVPLLLHLKTCAFGRPTCSSRPFIAPPFSFSEIPAACSSEAAAICILTLTLPARRLRPRREPVMLTILTWPTQKDMIDEQQQRYYRHHRALPSPALHPDTQTCPAASAQLYTLSIGRPMAPAMAAIRLFCRAGVNSDAGMGITRVI